MRDIFVRLLIVCFSCFAFGSIRAHANDWSQWCGSDGRNMVASETGLPNDFEPGRKEPTGSGIDPATTENVKWLVRLGSQTYGAPTVAGGRVYVGTNDFSLDDPRCKSTRGGLLMCLDEQSGELLWQLIAPRRHTDLPGALFNHLNLGICSSATIEGDRVYVLTSRAEIVCLDARGMADGNDGPYREEGQDIAGEGNPAVETTSTDADVLWKFDLLSDIESCPQDAACSSILIHGDVLYLSTSNGVDKSHDKVMFPLAPSLIALDKATGRLLAVDGEEIGTTLFHGQWSSPTLATIDGKPQIIFGAGDGLCYAFEPVDTAGEDFVTANEPAILKKIWSFDCNPADFKTRDGKPIPYRSGDKRIRSRYGDEIGNKNDGSHVGPSEIIATPVFHKNRIYIATGQDPAHGIGRAILTCIDATKTGDVTKTAKIWTHDIQRSLSTVSIADGLLYVSDLTGKLYCLDAETGQDRWIHETGEEVWASTLVADGKVYLGTRQNLWVLAEGAELEVLNKTRVSSALWCSPVVANGVLFVTSQRYLWAVEAPGE